MQHDPVNHPRHYTGHPSGVECITITEHMNFCLGNAMKYIWRAGEKGDAIEDLKKARWYLDREIARRDRPGAEKGPTGAEAPVTKALPPPALPGQNAPAAAPPPMRRSRRVLGNYRTPERAEILKRDWPAGRFAHEIADEMNALEGPPVPVDLMTQWAAMLGVKRPPGWDTKLAQAIGRRAAKERRQGRQKGDAVTWSQALAWAAGVDPDLVLRGTPDERLAQVNDLRVTEGKRPFVLVREAA